MLVDKLKLLTLQCETALHCKTRLWPNQDGKTQSAGWEAKNTRLLADKFAASGFSAALPGNVLCLYHRSQARISMTQGMYTTKYIPARGAFLTTNDFAILHIR